MIDLRKAVQGNKEEAIKKLEKFGSVIFNTNGDEAESYPSGEEPYIIVDWGVGEMEDLMVSKVRLENGDIEVYIPRYKDWYSVSHALAYTENNVYESIVGND